jgi:hypothetical protein
MTHAQRVLLGRLGAYTLHSRYDSAELVRPAREAFLSKFEREVDPEGLLDPAERARRADMARKAYFTRLALKSAQARAKRKSGLSGTRLATMADFGAEGGG